MQTELVLDQSQGKKTRRFLAHLFQMIVVMMLGMCVLGAAFGALHTALFGSGYAAAWRDHVGLAALAMAFNMTVPMVLWMRYCGHSWERDREMAVAMNLPLLPLLALYWLGAIPARGVLGLQMVLMIPAMVGVMLHRKEEYSAPHHRVGRLARSRWFAHAR
jgi:flagellar biosynthetic protein FliP